MTRPVPVPPPLQSGMDVNWCPGADCCYLRRPRRLEAPPMNITEYHRRRTSSDHDFVERVCSHHVAQVDFECAGLLIKRRVSTRISRLSISSRLYQIIRGHLLMLLCSTIISPSSSLAALPPFWVIKPNNNAEYLPGNEHVVVAPLSTHQP